MFMVSPRRDDPSDPEYPVVVCPTCMTRWFGHRDDKESKPLDPRLPAALRDAIILDQAEAAFAILEELGYSKAVRPNACIGASPRSNIAIESGQSVQITARPQTESFTPTHFVTGVDGFTIDDIRIGNRSLFMQAGSLPSEMFRLNVTAPGLIMRPGPDEEPGTAELEVVDGDLGELPLACSSFQWEPCLMMMDLVVVATNVSSAPRMFTSWFLGKAVRPKRFARPSNRAAAVDAAAAAWNQITGPGLLAQAGDIDEPE